MSPKGKRLVRVTPQVTVERLPFQCYGHPGGHREAAWHTERITFVEQASLNKEREGGRKF